MSTTPCKYFLKKGCKKNKCPFLHPRGSRSQELAPKGEGARKRRLAGK